MKYCAAIAVVLTLNFFVVKAQIYDVAVGFRAGFPTGLTYKQSMGNDLAFEGIIGVRNGITATALLEKHVPIFNDLLLFYFGAGAHGGTFHNSLDRNAKTVSEFGVDGIVGVDFTFPDFPFNFSVDIKPSFALRDGDFKYLSYGALSLRYVLR